MLPLWPDWEKEGILIFIRIINTSILIRKCHHLTKWQSLCITKSKVIVYELRHFTIMSFSGTIASFSASPGFIHYQN